jgi:serine/threonine-protein kinase
MGLVVKARHLGLDEEVAIKLLRDDVTIDDETIQRFLREAQAAVRLKSEHVCRITDVGRLENGKPYMIMEYLQGHDIGQMVDQQGGLHPHLAVDLLIQACDAIAEAHSLGIIHRDIKPSNLFVTFRPDGSAILKVLDFGISKSANQDLSLTQTQSMLGTPAYMSPEQMRSARKVDNRTDIWSLGSVLYEAVEGHLPFFAESFSEMCVKVAVDNPETMVRMPPELQPIVLKCLAKNPDHRYASVAELAVDLAKYARDPQSARTLVDRMLRLHHRSTGGSGIGIQPYASTSMASAPVAASPHLTVDEPPRKNSRAWIAIPVVIFLAIGGIVVGALLTGGSNEQQAADGSGSSSAPLIVPTAASGSGSGSGSDSVAASGSDSDSGSGSGSDAVAGSGSAMPPTNAAGTRRPPVVIGNKGTTASTNVTTPPPSKDAGSAAGSASKTPCDPFGNRVNCK